jgi:hypothetical protein
MYARLWRLLPGPLPVRVLLAAALVALAVAALYGVVFPWAVEHLPLDRTTVG